MISGILGPLSFKFHDDPLVPSANVDVSAGGGKFSLALHDHVYLILRGDQILELKNELCIFFFNLSGKVFFQPHVISFAAAVVFLKVIRHRGVGEVPFRRKAVFPTGSLLLPRIFRKCGIAYLEMTHENLLQQQLCRLEMSPEGGKLSQKYFGVQ